MAKLLNEILGGSSRPRRKRISDVVEEGKKLQQRITPYLDAHERGDELLTKEGIYERLKNHGWCPDSANAVDAALRRAGAKPFQSGKKGRGKAAQWWFSEAVAALKKHKRIR